MACRHLVIDVQILMIASGLSAPPDDGSAINLLKRLDVADQGRLVWDSGGLIRSQYEAKIKGETFGRDWLVRMLQNEKVVSVDRARLPTKAKQAIMATGLVGEDLQYYVRTAANSPDERLVSHDSDYDSKTCSAMKKELRVRLLSAAEGTEFVDQGV